MFCYKNENNNNSSLQFVGDWNPFNLIINYCIWQSAVHFHHTAVLLLLSTKHGYDFFNLITVPFTVWRCFQIIIKYVLISVDETQQTIHRVLKVCGNTVLYFEGLETKLEIYYTGIPWFYLPFGAWCNFDHW